LLNSTKKKKSNLPNLSYAIPVKKPGNIFFGHRQANHKIYMKCEGTTVAKIFKEFIFSICYRAMLIKMVCYLGRCKFIEQWNKIENPEIDQHNDSHLFFDKELKQVNMGRKYFNT
jgi:hypothetical protein